MQKGQERRRGDGIVQSKHPQSCLLTGTRGSGEEEGSWKVGWKWKKSNKFRKSRLYKVSYCMISQYTALLME